MAAHTFLIRHTTSRRYVEQRPYDGAWTWLAPWATYATVFPQLGYAEQIATHMEQDEPGCTEIIELDERGNFVRVCPTPIAARKSA